LDKELTIPNTHDGFTAFWAHLQRRQAETGAAEIVCAVEPTGTYHEALARFLEAQGADVVLVSNTVAHFNRRTLDGTWGKPASSSGETSDPKDAHNLCDLLERGHVLFYSLPDAPLAALRRLVRLLRHARVELGAGKARFRNTLWPALGPAGEPLPGALVASLPPPLSRLCPAPAEAGRRRRPQSTPPGPAQGTVASAVPPALAFELTDLAARLTAVQARIATIEAELVRIAQPLPVYTWLRSIPGVGPTLAAILLAEIGDIAWYTKFSTRGRRRRISAILLTWASPPDPGLGSGRGAPMSHPRSRLAPPRNKIALHFLRLMAGVSSTPLPWCPPAPPPISPILRLTPIPAVIACAHLDGSPTATEGMAPFWCPSRVAAT
jgi:transposase